LILGFSQELSVYCLISFNNILTIRLKPIFISIEERAMFATYTAKYTKITTGKEIPLGKRRFPLKGIEASIESQQTNCASKLNCGQNIKLGGI
jgi:hypothetical protein